MYADFMPCADGYFQRVCGAQRTKSTALHIAAIEGHVEVVRALLSIVERREEFVAAVDDVRI